ncbi:MAG: NADH-quinone oxidoreductase subunit H [Cyanobacteria bacterium NC_groundwater_1444_Ag_S-0.65um_54_12]|nr:NADH-quinone oxidoreductase subunit H [Cyanobacteria bacterium NC_groundwater_1444_Ag_S-0.65um_54_12]
MNYLAFSAPLSALVLAPFLQSVINRTKATLAGRQGQPLLQPYHDLWKLLRKGAVYSSVTTVIFRLGPTVSLATGIMALFLLPLGGFPAPLAFAGDFLLLAYLLGLGRFFTVLAALDTGSSFEGMGASREVLFSSLAEPALLLALATLCRLTDASSLSAMLAGVNQDLWLGTLPALLIVICTLGVVLLAENCRIPVDDPTTHLELTMIHEVMVLDHSGPDLAFNNYGATLKLWVFSAILAGLVMPLWQALGLPPWLAFGAGMLTVAIAIGVTESVMARLRMDRVPKLLLSASLLATLALFLQQR